MNDRKTAVGILVILLVILVVVVVLGAAGIFFAHKPWTGLSSSLPTAVIGTYDLEACRVDVGKIGGWCGKECHNYGTGHCADCAPLLKVEQVK